MSIMNWGAFDLNLLIVFDAVMQDRSVTRAGQRVGLSQPAMSHALNRLRYMLKDELFIRTPDGMVPTPRAELLAPPLRNALSEMQHALEPAAFDPASSDRRFVVTVNNYAAVMLVAPLVAAVSSAAPRVTLDVQPSGTLNIVERLDRGDFELALGIVESPGERFVSTPLLDDSFVVLMRRGHPASRGKLSLKRFASLPHLDVSSFLVDTSFVDRQLAEHGLVRSIALRAPLLSAAAILAQSDLVVTFSRRVAQEFARHHPLEFRDPPYEVPRLRTHMLWHRRLERHPAHRWLRDITTSVAKGL